MSWVDVTSAVGTAAAAVVALGLGLRGEWRAMRAEQTQRVQNKREQAERVSGWPQNDVDGKTPIALMNSSLEPVYEVVVALVFVQGLKPWHLEDINDDGMHRRVLSVLPPGKWHVDVPSGWTVMHRRPGVEIAFSDRAGLHWIRRSNGAIEQISVRPIDYLKLGRPQTLEIPIPGH